MKVMKKLGCAMLIAGMFVGAVGCGKNDNSSSKSNQEQNISDNMICVGYESHDYAFFTRDYAINDLMTTKNNNYVYISYKDNSYSIKSINLLDGTVTYENAVIFEVSSTAKVQRIKCTGTDSYNFIVMEDDKTDIYDELGNYIFTTTVPIYYSLNDTQKMWRTKDNKFYVYNNTNEKESNIYVYNTSTATETTIATEKPVVYAFMADESNIIYSTKSKSGNYTYIMKNIETTEETELFVCKYGVLYSCNEYGFVIGKTNTNISYISDIPCDVIMYNKK